MSDFLLDLKLVRRSLARRPGFTLVVILTLALGIGANSAIFTVVNAVLLKPLPYKNPDRLALIWSRWNNFDKTWLSDAEFIDYQGMKRLFQDAAAWTENGEVALTGAEGPESVDAMAMTANLLDVLGMPPAVGRTFSADEDIPNGPAVAMVGYELWKRRYGGDRGLLGRTINVDGTPTRIVGILAPDFRFPLEFQSRTPVQIIQPYGLDRAAPQRGSHGSYAIGRLQPGITAEAVTTELQALTKRWTKEGLYPESMQFTAFSVPLVDEVSGKVRAALVVLTATVGLLLLLTCANVANLILARADGRSREIAVRSALGAGRAQIVRLALTESVMLALAGAFAGLVLAWIGVRILVARAPTSIPRLSEVTVDLKVFGFTLVIAVLTGVLCGLFPAFAGSGASLADQLRDGRGQSGSLARTRSRKLLVTAEMALAVLLVIGAGLTIRSFLNLMRIDPGFDADRTLSLRLALPQNTYPSTDNVLTFYNQLGAEVRQLAGVKSAGFVRLLPLASEIGDAGMTIEGRPVPPGEQGRSADWQAVTPGFFETMKIRLVRGRFIDSTDTKDGQQVIVVNETLVKQYFPNEDPIGQRIRVGPPTAPFRTVVGIVGDVHHNSITTPVKRAWFIPLDQWANSYSNVRRGMTLVVRSSGDPRALIDPVTSLVHKRDPDLTVSQVATLDDVLSAATREQRFVMALMTGFAVLALVLAGVGIYGVISYWVNQRTREIGIRLALGANAGSVRGLVLRQGLAPAMLGIGAGLGAAILLSRFIGALLYGVAPVDPFTFLVIPLMLLVVAAASAFLPAVRAARLDPLEALRAE